MTQRGVPNSRRAAKGAAADARPPAMVYKEVKGLTKGLEILKVLNRYPGGLAFVTELAAACDLDRSTIGRNVQVLQRHGLVEETECRDLRRSMLGLTDLGRQRLDAAAPLWQAAQAEIEATLGPDRLSVIASLSGAF